jgi:hypothetical protein
MKINYNKIGTFLNWMCLPAFVGAFVAAAVHNHKHPTPKPPPTYRVVVIEGCEYLVTEIRGNEALTHKGNCTNH